MRKFKHLPTKTIYKYNNGDVYMTSDKYNMIPVVLTINSNDWEEVVEKEWKITAFRYKGRGINILGKHGTFIHPNYPDASGNSLDICLKEVEDNESEIYSVKRLSDEVEFKIGDNISWGAFEDFRCEITGFAIDRIQRIGEIHILTTHKNQPNCFVYLDHYKLRVINKQPLFTTEDGVEIFKGDYWWYIYTDDLGFGKKSWTPYTGNDNYQPSYGDKIKRFSTKEKAEEYIIENKPCLNYQDIKHYIDSWYKVQQVKALIKQKLNL